MTPKVLEFNKLFDASIENYEEGKKVFNRMALLWWNMNYEDHKCMKASIFNPYFTKQQCSICSAPLVYYLDKMEIRDFMGVLYSLCAVYRCIKCCEINWMSDNLLDEEKKQIIDDPKFHKFAKNYQ